MPHEHVEDLHLGPKGDEHPGPADECQKCYRELKSGSRPPAPKPPDDAHSS